MIMKKKKKKRFNRTILPSLLSSSPLTFTIYLSLSSLIHPSTVTFYSPSSSLLLSPPTHSLFYSVSPLLPSSLLSPLNLQISPSHQLTLPRYPSSSPPSHPLPLFSSLLSTSKSHQLTFAPHMPHKSSKQNHPSSPPPLSKIQNPKSKIQNLSPTPTLQLPRSSSNSPAQTLKLSNSQIQGLNSAI